MNEKGKPNLKLEFGFIIGVLAKDSLWRAHQ